MLTIMICDANPDVSLPAPPHLEMGHYLLLTGQKWKKKENLKVGTNTGGWRLEPGVLMQCVVRHKGREGEGNLNL